MDITYFLHKAGVAQLFRALMNEFLGFLFMPSKDSKQTQLDASMTTVHDS